MHTRNKELSPGRERRGLVSHILLQRDALPEAGLTATWAEVAPGARQRPTITFGAGLRDYYGRGKILAGEEEREVGAGDLIYVYSCAIHCIENASEKVPIYVSAAALALDAEAAYFTGQLRPEG